MGIVLKNRAELAEHFAKKGFNRGAEIGVDEGKYSIALCQANPNLRLFCIDAWGLGEPKITAKRLASYERAQQNLAPYNAVIVRKPSLEAVRDFADGALDFVYIDADHKFDAVVNDIIEWTKKVRKGGIVSGHDYNVAWIKLAAEGFTVGHHLTLNATTEPDNGMLSWWFNKKWSTT